MYLSQGPPKATPSFEDLPEELTELRKPVIFMVMVYYSKRCRLNKISKGKRHTEWSRGENSGKLFVNFFTVEFQGQCLTLLPVQVTVPAREGHQGNGGDV